MTRTAPCDLRASRCMVLALWTGESVPPLGSKLDEIEEERVARKAGRTDDIQWSMGVVYTMCFRT